MISFDVTQVMLFSGLLWCVNFYIVFFKKVAITNSDLIKMLLGCISLTLISSLFYTKLFSGTGTASHYGLPHYFFTTWESFDKATVTTSFNAMYLLVNIIFYFSVAFFVVLIFKKRGSPKKNER